jgi:hypothetical protein
VTLEGYGDHPVAQAFRGRRATLWIEPRGVTGGDALVESSTGKAVAAAVSDGARIVVLGSARSFMSEALDLQAAANDSFAASAVAWLTGRSKLVGVGAKTPEQFRVVMTPAQVSRLFYGCVVILPLLAGALGAVLHVRRRRGA